MPFVLGCVVTPFLCGWGCGQLTRGWGACSLGHVQGWPWLRGSVYIGAGGCVGWRWGPTSLQWLSLGRGHSYLFQCVQSGHEGSQGSLDHSQDWCCVWLAGCCSPVPVFRMTFLGHGVGEGSVLCGMLGAAVVGLPLGVTAREGFLAAHSGFFLVAVGVAGPGSGVVPEAVHFFPTVRVGVQLVEGAFKGKSEA
ncbi:hypothetical protein BJV74DRAFT_794962 [Russula compacta]|nr:hypothetical protein BJV74DRAFT_794962 [Russula compacta]